jgi:hypothetical protein
MRVDHAELKSEIQVEQVQGVFEYPQASSCEDANIIGSRQAPVHLTTVIEFVYLYILIMIFGCALCYRSWIDTLVALRQLFAQPL